MARNKNNHPEDSEKSQLTNTLNQLVVMKYDQSIASPEERAEKERHLTALEQANTMLNEQWHTQEFGSSLRFVQEMQGAVKTPEGGLVQFHADKDNGHSIVDILEVPDGTERMRTDGLISCCALEAHVGDFSVLLHGFGSANLQSLLTYSLKQINDRGGNLADLQEITLYAENHWDYKAATEALVNEVGLNVPVEFGPLWPSDHLAYPMFPTIDVF